MTRLSSPPHHVIARMDADTASRYHIPADTKLEIARLVNEEKLLMSSVAKRMNVTQASVARIASAAKWTKPRDDSVMPPRPFPDGSTPSLRGKTLTAEEKYYLACLVNIKRLPGTKVATLYDLPVSTLMAICKRAREGRSLEANPGGQPRAIDAASDQQLRALAELDAQSRPSKEEMTSPRLVKLQSVEGKLRQPDKKRPRLLPVVLVPR